MTTAEPTLGARMRAKFEELDIRRQQHIAGIDQAIRDIANLRALDRHLVEQGFHDELQLAGHFTEDPPIEELPDFADDGPTGTSIAEAYRDVAGQLSSRGAATVMDQAADKATPPPDPPKGDPVPAASTKRPDSPPPRSATSRRFTPEQKADAVRLADELGSDSEAARQSGTTSTSIKAWRDAGHGRKFKSVNETATPRTEKRTDAHDGPKTKCPICRDLVSIEGEVNEVSRAAALQKHYEAKPACGEAVRKKRR